MHALVSAEALPLRIALGPGNEHDSTRLVELLQGVKVPQATKRGGRPRTRPAVLAADGAYDTRAIREYLRRRGIRATIPRNRRNRQTPQRGRPPQFSRGAYRQLRNCVERFFAWLTTGFRRLALRWERLAITFLGFIQLACIMMLRRVLR